MWKQILMYPSTSACLLINISYVDIILQQWCHPSYLIEVQILRYSLIAKELSPFFVRPAPALPLSLAHTLCFLGGSTDSLTIIWGRMESWISLKLMTVPATTASNLRPQYVRCLCFRPRTALLAASYWQLIRMGTVRSIITRVFVEEEVLLCLSVVGWSVGPRCRGRAHLINLASDFHTKRISSFQSSMDMLA
jgi:hypothetical protein